MRTRWLNKSGLNDVLNVTVEFSFVGKAGRKSKRFSIARSPPRRFATEDAIDVCSIGFVSVEKTRMPRQLESEWPEERLTRVEMESP